MRRKVGRVSWRRWDFIHDTINEVWLTKGLVDLILNYICSTSMQILWNGATITEFKPSRGVRQEALVQSIHLFIIDIDDTELPSQVMIWNEFFNFRRRGINIRRSAHFLLESF